MSSAGSRSSDKARPAGGGGPIATRCGRRHRADLRSSQHQPPRMEGAAERQPAPWRRRTSSARRRWLQRRPAAGPWRVHRPGAGVEHDVGLGSRAAGVANPTPRRSATARRAAPHVDQLDLAARDAGRQPGDQQPDDAAAHHRDAVARPERARPTARSSRSRCWRPGRRVRGGTPSGTGARPRPGRRSASGAGAGEHRAAGKRPGPVLDDADAGVAVLHRQREVAGLKRRAHPLVFFDRHRPRNTSASVPRLTPLCSVRTTTSSAPGAGSPWRRISPRPGAAVQNASASSAMPRADAAYRERPG